MGRYFDMQFTLEREMIRAKHHKQNTGRWPSAKTNNRSEFAHLCAFAGMVSNVFARLPPLGRNRLRNQIRGGLKDGRGLAPLAFEMRTAAHALRRGLDVTFHDLCEGGGYDFLVKGSGIEFEVECKSVSVDLGRPIHLHRQYQLGGRIYARMRSAQSPGLVKVLVATLPSRLYPKHEFMESVAKRIGHALDQCADLNDLQPCSVS
jgi:hypothetical protein